jgi:choline dehydrogenase-like flavoprotein
MTASPRSARPRFPRSVDVLIVGSGPVGSAFARHLHETTPAATILMVDGGPQLTARPGMNVRNIADPGLMAQAQARSLGPALAAGQPRSPLALPGTHLVSSWRADETGAGAMPAAAMSTNVGGMGAHWTCGTPRPSGSERITFIPADEADSAFSDAERLLSVTSAAFPASPRAEAILAALRGAYAELLPPGAVRRLPLACQPGEDGLPVWAGADTVLGPLAEGPPGGRFSLRADTLCRRLLLDGDQVTGAELEHLPTAEAVTVLADVVAVAADALRSPQLLWASGIRPPALGRYLNDQPHVLASVALRDAIGALPRVEAGGRRPGPVMGVFQIPFRDEVHPWHGQVMHLSAFPLQFGPGQHELRRNGYIGLGWFCAKHPRWQDRIEFADDRPDATGMPAMTIRYSLSPADRASIDAAIRDQARAAEAVGGFIRGHGPRLLPAGSSLHYQGTLRMGAVDDGASVCDSYGRVWGFRNLFVGGNGVIPTATACNPTLTSVALAVRSCGRITGLLGAGRADSPARPG